MASMSERGESVCLNAAPPSRSAQRATAGQASYHIHFLLASYFTTEPGFLLHHVNDRPVLPVSHSIAVNAIFCYLAEWHRLLLITFASLSALS